MVDLWGLVREQLARGDVVCPLHGSEFALSTGAVVRSPAEFPLYKANVAARSDGYVWFVTDA